jgi:hypothetical protein
MHWCPALVEIEGIDPKLVKGQSHTFHTSTNGRTTISSSAIAIHTGHARFLVAPALTFQRFLSTSKRNHILHVSHGDLLPSTRITAHIKHSDPTATTTCGCKLLCCFSVDALEAQLSSVVASARSSAAGWTLGWSLTPDTADPLVSTPQGCSSFALLSMDEDPTHAAQQARSPAALQAAAATSHASPSSTPAPRSTAHQHQPSGRSLAWSPLQHQAQPACPGCSTGSQPITAGRAVLVRGSPFGCLAPTHFTSCHISGYIANTFTNTTCRTAPQRQQHPQPSPPPTSPPQPYTTHQQHSQQHHQSHAHPSPTSQPPPAAQLQAHHNTTSSSTSSSAATPHPSPPHVCMLDSCCFPGMEGAPVCCQACGHLLALLLPPLRNGHVELPLAASWHLLEAALLPIMQRQALQPSTALSGPSSTHSTLSSSSMQSSSSSGPCQLAPAAAAAAMPLAPLPAPSTPSRLPAAIRRAQQAVVMVRAGGSWASGVLVSAGGVVLTNAHLFHEERAAAVAARKARQKQQQQQQRGQQQRGQLETDLSEEAACPGISCQVKLAGGAGSGLPGGSSWLPATLLHLFTGYLDLAVLQLQLPRSYAIAWGTGTSLGALLHQGMALPTAGAQHSALSVHGTLQETSASSKPGPALPYLQLAPLQELAAGSRVAVLGHGLFGPGTGWPASASFGDVASVVAVRGRPSMVVSTAAVHQGGSGGPLVDCQVGCSCVCVWGGGGSCDLCTLQWGGAGCGRCCVCISSCQAQAGSTSMCEQGVFLAARCSMNAPVWYGFHCSCCAVHALLCDAHGPCSALLTEMLLHHAAAGSSRWLGHQQRAALVRRHAATPQLLHRCTRAAGCAGLGTSWRAGGGPPACTGQR